MPNYLVLTLQDEEFARIILTPEDSPDWLQRTPVDTDERTVNI
jgi:hypothetical protein